MPTQNQFNAIFDLCYNWGTGHFQEHNLSDVLMSDPNDPVIDSIWLQVGLRDAKGNKLPGLLLRRKNEVFLYHSPDDILYNFNWHL